MYLLAFSWFLHTCPIPVADFPLSSPPLTLAAAVFLTFVLFRVVYGSDGCFAGVSHYTALCKLHSEVWWCSSPSPLLTVEAILLENITVRGHGILTTLILRAGSSALSILTSPPLALSWWPLCFACVKKLDLSMLSPLEPLAPMLPIFIPFLVFKVSGSPSYILWKNIFVPPK